MFRSTTLPEGNIQVVHKDVVLRKVLVVELVEALVESITVEVLIKVRMTEVVGAHGKEIIVVLTEIERVGVLDKGAVEVHKAESVGVHMVVVLGILGEETAEVHSVEIVEVLHEEMSVEIRRIEVQTAEAAGALVEGISVAVLSRAELLVEVPAVDRIVEDVTVQGIHGGRTAGRTLAGRAAVPTTPWSAVDKTAEYRRSDDAVKAATGTADGGDERAVANPNRGERRSRRAQRTVVQRTATAAQAQVHIPDLRGEMRCH